MTKQTIIHNGRGTDLFIYAHIDPAAIQDTVEQVTDDHVVTELWGVGTSAYRPLLSAYGGWKKYIEGVATRCGVDSFDHTCVVGWSAGGAFAQQVLVAAKNDVGLWPDAVVLLDAVYGAKPNNSQPGDGRVLWSAKLAALEQYAVAAAKGERILVMTHSAIQTPYASSGECVRELVRRVEMALGKNLEQDEEAQVALVGHPPALARRIGNFRVISFVGATAAEHIAEAHLYDEVWREWIPWNSAPSSGEAAELLRARALKQGDRGPDVVNWQKMLCILGQAVEADGVFGPRTAAATRMFQASAARTRPKLSVDGVVGPATRAAAAEELRWREAPGPPSFQPLDVATRDQIFGKIEFVPAPKVSNPEAIEITNGWHENIVMAYIPQLANAIGAPQHLRVPFHRKAVPQLQRLFELWEKAGLLPFVLSWDGAWVPRFVRGKPGVLSKHAHGIAFDINAAWNPMGKAPPIGKGNVRPLVALARECGFFWGGDFTRQDPMHFEIARLLQP